MAILTSCLWYNSMAKLTRCLYSKTVWQYLPVVCTMKQLLTSCLYSKTVYNIEKLSVVKQYGNIDQVSV